MANAEQTRLMLSMFNNEFATSKKEQINKFLHDQQELNKRFDEYALHSDSDEDEPSASAKNLQRKYSIGVSPEELQKNLDSHQDREDDRESLDSVLTACSNSDSDEDRNPPTSALSTRPMHKKLPLSTPKFEAPDRRMNRGVARSQSLRVSNKTDLSTLKHVPQPPNSPELNREDDKPSLEGLKIGRKHSLRESKRSRPPKKLLNKRSERPKSALGYQTSLSLVNENAYAEEHGFAPVNRHQYEAQNRMPVANDLPNKSAPNYKNRVLNWDTACPPKHQADSEHIPSLSTALETTRSRAPTYAPAPLPSHARPHPPVPQPPEAKPTSNNLARNSSIRQSIKKRNSESSMPLSMQPKDAPLKPINNGRLGSFSIPIKDLDEVPFASEQHTGRMGGMRRFKGHGNLADNQLTPRGAHLAVLKLPPVSSNKKGYPNSEMPVRPGTSLSFFNTSETLV